MTDSFTMNLVAKANILGWYVAGYTESEWEFRRSSPAGEDFTFTITADRSENVWVKIYKFAKNFDIYDHALARCNEEDGQKFEAMLDDAYDLKELMEELADTLEELTEMEEAA